MGNSIPGNARKSQKGRCRPARLAGILGILLALWTWGYALLAVQENLKELPAVILIGLMVIGGLMDCVRFGREGKGGMIVVLSGVVLYVFLILDRFVLKRFYHAEAHLAAFLGTLLLFVSGFLFSLCARKRGERKASP